MKRFVVTLDAAAVAAVNSLAENVKMMGGFVSDVCWLMWLLLIWIAAEKNRGWIILRD